MENITLGQIQSVLVFVIALGGSITVLYKAVMKGIDKALAPINHKIDEVSRKVDKVDKNATMNYLVRCMDDIERGVEIDRASRQRLLDQYEHYIRDLNGNTYIKEEFDRLKRSGKI